MYIIMKKKIQKTLTINCENISLLLLLLLLSCFSHVWLCETPIDGSPPGSSVSVILQARTLEWVAISFSSAWKWKVKVRLLSRVRFLATSWTAAYQAPPSMGFSRQEYWSGVPLPSPLAPWEAQNARHKNHSVNKKNRDCRAIGKMPPHRAGKGITLEQCQWPWEL